MHSESGNQRRVHRRLRVLAFAALALVGVAVLVYFAWPGSSAAPASNSAAPASNSTGGAASSPGQTARTDAGPSAHIAAWNAGQGGATLAAIWSNLGTALMAHSLEQFAQMRQECRSLALDVKTASMQPPIPDAATQYLYKKAQASLAAGAAKCQAGIKGKGGTSIHANRKLLNAAMSELSIGNQELSSATEKIKAPRRPGSSQ